MIQIAQIGVVTTFCLFVFFDLCSLAPRVAGSIADRNALGYSFNVIMNTIKRIFIVSYPPMLGLISIIADFQTLLTTVFFSYYSSLLPLMIVVLLRERIIAFFCSLVVSYDETGGMVRSVCSAVKNRNNWRAEVREHVSTGSRKGRPLNFYYDIKLVVIASWVYLFYGASMFLINIFAVRFDQYSEIIYQMVGFFNAIGTLAFAFILDPRLSRIYERRVDLGRTYNSLIAAHFINLVLLGPALIAIVIMLFI